MVPLASQTDRLVASSVPEGIGRDEWDLRCDLAAAYQLIDLYGMSDLLATHISARVPDAHEVFLLNPVGTLFDQITASSLIKVDWEGRVVEGTQSGLNPAGFVIHSAVHVGKPDITCVLHTHTVAINGVGAMEEGLLPLTQTAIGVLTYLSYHDYEGISTDLAERARIVEDFGENGRAMLLRNHGALTIGSSIAEAWVRMYRLEMACRMQVAAMANSSGGLTPIILKDDIVRRSMEQAREFMSERGAFSIGTTGWPSLLRKLDRERGNSYQT